MYRKYLAKYHRVMRYMSIAIYDIQYTRISVTDFT